MAEIRLFDEATLRKLESLTLIAHKVRVGVMKGDRRSAKHGTSIEFADYRDYARGDDLRRLDWNVYARLERPFIKLLEEEEDLTVHLLLDTSQSMHWPEEVGEENTRKSDYARQLAGALGAIGLSAGDRVAFAALKDGVSIQRWGPSRTSGRTLSLLDHLTQLTFSGKTDLNAALSAYALSGGRPGLAILISDLFSPEGYLMGLDALLSRGYEAAILHTLSPDELAPSLGGDLRLIDSETGEGRDISLNLGMRRLYSQRLIDWQAEINAACMSRGAHYIPLTTAMPWEKVILNTLRHAGLVK